MSENVQMKDVLYVTSNERAINYKWEDDCNKLDRGLQVVSIDDIMNEDIVFFNKRKNDIQLDSIFIRHPLMPNTYVDINSAEDVFMKIKLDCLGHIANLLGAKEYETTYLIEEKGERKVDVNGNMAISKVSAEVSVEIDKNSERTRKYYRHEKFNSILTEESYALAELKAKEYNMDNGVDIRYLINNRNPKLPNNQLTSQIVKMELYDELNSKMDIAFSLKVANIFKLRGEYSEAMSSRKKVVIETKLIF
jgi:hypothetical protein